MTERERWTVYPLLFLTLGIALKDKVLNQVTTGNVRCEAMVCEALLVDDPRGRDRVSIAAGDIRCQNLVASSTLASKQNVIGAAMVVADQQGEQRATLAADAEGGFLRLVGTGNGVITFLGNTEQLAGLMFVDPDGKIHLREGFAVTGQPEEQPPPGEQPAEEPKPSDEASPQADESE